MNGPCLPHERNRNPVLHATSEPVPAKHGKRRPLEARTRWDPWLPLTEASGEVAGPLHVIALAVLAVAALFVIAMTLMMLSSL